MKEDKPKMFQGINRGENQEKEVKQNDQEGTVKSIKSHVNSNDRLSEWDRERLAQEGLAIRWTVSAIDHREQYQELKEPIEETKVEINDADDESQEGSYNDYLYDTYSVITSHRLDEGDERVHLAMLNKSTDPPKPPGRIKGDKTNLLWKWLQELNARPSPAFLDLPMGQFDRKGLGYGIDYSKPVERSNYIPRKRTRPMRPIPERTSKMTKNSENQLNRYNQKQIKQYLKDMMEKEWGTRQLPKATIAYIWHKNYSPSPIIEMYVEGIGPKRVLIDSGAGVSLISTSWFKQVMKQWKDDEIELRYAGPAWELGGITGPDLPTMGKYKLIFQVNDSSFPVYIAISNDPAGDMDYRIKNIDAILGMNFLLKYKVILDFHERMIRIGKQAIPYVNERPEMEETLSIGAIPINQEPMKRQENQPMEKDFECEEFEIKNDICLKPSSCSWFMFYAKKAAFEDLWIPSQIVSPGIVVLKTVWNEGQNRVWIGIRNELAQPCEIEKDTKVWLQVKRLNENDRPRSYIGAMIQDPEIDRQSPSYQKEWRGVRDEVVAKATELDAPDKIRLEGIFEEFFDIMRLKHEPPGEVKTYEVEIKLKKYEPIYIRPYALSDVIQEEIDRQLGVMLKHKIIRPSISEWNFPIVAVKKKILDLQHDKVHDIRMCIDFRPMNDITEEMTWPIPTVEDTLRRLGGAKFFTTLDVLSGFWTLPVKEQHRKYLAFATKLAHYEFCRMPFGWINSPFHFQRYMQTQIADKNRDCCQVYIDDIIIYSKDKEEHFQHIRKVLKILAEEGLYLKMMKVHAFQPQIEYLGHIISREGIKKDPKKVEAILKCKDPVNKKQVRQILGKANYIGKFIANLADITGPMSKVTSSSEKVPFVWGEEQKIALKRLKKAIIQDVMLAFPDSSKPYNITTDASDYAVSGVLSQTDDKTKLERPIMFISKSLNETERRYTVTEKELLAIIHALDKFRPYIYGRQFHVYTDHRALIWLCGKKNPMSRLGRWSMRIAEYSAGIHFIAGKQNRVADALSRAPFVDEPILEGMDEYQSNKLIPENIKEQIAAMAGIKPEDLKDEKPDTWENMLDFDIPKKSLKWESYEMMRFAGLIMETDWDGNEDPKNVKIQKEDAREWFPTLMPKYWAQQTDEKDIPNRIYKDEEGILWDRAEDIFQKDIRVLWVPTPFRREVLRAFHDTPMSAHPSGRKMYWRMRQQVTWKGMLKDVMEYCKRCGLCQKNRFGLREKPEFQSRGKPMRPMQRISMDILSLEGVRAPGPANVLVMVDEFTRYAEAYPIANMEAETVADKLVEEFICRYGIPEEILTDRGSNFMSDLFLELCRQLKIQKLNTTAYHPENNGANERMHGTLYTILRASTNNNGRDWKRQLPIAMFVYRNTIHKSIGLSPHQALYGYTSRHECLDEGLLETTFPLDERVQALYDMREHVQARMEQVEKENHHRSNKERRLRCYEPGDQVMLRNHVRHKLQTPWRGPYTVVNRFGKVNYEIQLPPGDRTHKIFHVQHLKPWLTPQDEVLSNIPEEDENEIPALIDLTGAEIQETEKTEGKRKKTQGRSEEQVLLPDPEVTSRPMTRAYAKKLASLL